MKPKTISTVKDLEADLSSLRRIFDNVRLIDPIAQKVISFDSSENIVYDDMYCYEVWSKEGKCDNCICTKTYNENSRKTKFEFNENNIFYIVTKPVKVKTNSHGVITAIIQISSEVSNEILFEAFGKNDFVKKIIETNKKIYEDSLTKVYNRRYFDERLFFQENRNSPKMAFIMLDLKDFKNINDSYGHIAGDNVLKKVAVTLKKNVRDYDSIVRLGGDEFLIILQNCDEVTALKKIEKLKSALNSIFYNEKEGLFIEGDFGFAITDSFINSESFITAMLCEADFNMYKFKKRASENAASQI